MAPTPDGENSLTIVWTQYRRYNTRRWMEGQKCYSNAHADVITRG